LLSIQLILLQKESLNIKLSKDGRVKYNQPEESSKKNLPVIIARNVATHPGIKWVPSAKIQIQ